jgi:PleD family two-component response regulator
VLLCAGLGILYLVTVSVSAGVARGDDGQDMVTLMAQADLALYDAKRAGRGRVRRYLPSAPPGGEAATA